MPKILKMKNEVSVAKLREIFTNLPHPRAISERELSIKVDDKTDERLTIIRRYNPEKEEDE